MVRALTVLYPAAARSPIVSGWLPLQLLCQHARNKGDNSHHGVRATPALLSALRAAYPGAATECLPCGQGEVSMPGAQRCTRCPKGSKPRKRDGVFVCELCPMGVHSDDSCPQ